MLRRAVYIGFGFLMTGCASVTITKVKSGDSQPDGIPFYLPRPYVQIFEPFVVSSKVHIVGGVVTSDGNYLQIDNAKTDLSGLLQLDISKEAASRVSMANVRVTDPVIAGSPNSEVVPALATPKIDKPADETPIKTEATPQGMFAQSITQSATPFPSTLGRRFFDIVWMPDFDEKYVLVAKPGLGNSNIGVTMVQGWGLYGMDARIDNSALVKPLLNFYSTGLDSLTKLATSKIIPASALTGSPNSALVGDDAKRQLPPLTRVAVKITRITVAAPGIYPVLKPAEFTNAAKPVAGDNRINGILVPIHPYTNIAFNVYDILQIEAARVIGDVPLHLQSNFELGAPPAPAAAAASGSEASTKVDISKATDDVNKLLASAKSSDAAYWQIEKLEVKNKELHGTVQLKGGKEKPETLKDMRGLRDFVSLQIPQFPSESVFLKEK